MKTFPIGGVHPSENKLSGAKPIEVLPLPDVVTIPLSQHIGAPAVAKVAKGDKVLTGQLIAEAGRTGGVTGPHLHYEVMYMGQVVNPINYFNKDMTAEEYNKLMEEMHETTMETD